jgi:uncharacterized membrane protein YheB (UPF0754 family)
MTSIPWYVLIILIPGVCAVIGWLTNVVAVKMLFRPYHAKKLGKFRFQGVLPKHHRHFARQLAGVITNDFMTTGEMVRQANLEHLFRKLKPVLEELIPSVLGELKDELSEGQKKLLTDDVLESIRPQIEAKLEEELPALIKWIETKADDALNLTDLIAQKVVDWGPIRLEEVIYEVSSQELKFIEYYGGIFGFLIGLGQYGLITLLPMNYLLPIVGMGVGVITNYLAIQMLFYPRQPRGIGPFKFQGLFPKRQGEIAQAQAKIAAAELIIADEIFIKLIDALIPKEIDDAAAEHYEDLIGSRFPAIKSMVEMVLTKDQRVALRLKMVDRFRALLPQISKMVATQAAEQIDVHKILFDKVATLPKLAFEQLLRGLFKEEEVYLVIYGGLLGGLMGLVQLGLISIRF